MDDRLGLRLEHGSGTVLSAVTDLDAAPQMNEEVVRLTLEVSVTNRDFLTSYAAYRNAIADVKETKLRNRWSPKNTGEHFLAIKCDEMRSQLAELYEKLGPLPEFIKGDKKSEAAMRDYAERAIALVSTKKK